MPLYNKHHLQLDQQPKNERKVENLVKLESYSLSKLRSMFALLSPNWLKALHLYMPPSSRLGFLMVSVRMYLFFFSGQHLQLI